MAAYIGWSIGDAIGSNIEGFSNGVSEILITLGVPAVYLYGEHTSGARPSTKGTHEKGQSRREKDRGGEKGDKGRRPPNKKPPGFKGPWPPK